MILINSFISIILFLDVDQEDAPEEGFVELTNIHDTTAADIYRAGRSKFPIAEEFVYYSIICFK
jgi:hypothetical protein